MSNQNNGQHRQQTGGRKEMSQKMGTFAGVFTPSILTILGLILFLRLGYLVGGIGLAGVIGVILVANLISILTSVSLAAVTTNLRVKGGGIYYLIARTLGVEHGGTIGLVMFVAQSISIGFYCVGFAEVAAAMAGVEDQRITLLIAGCAVFSLFVLAWLGADWATRFQFVVMALLAAALVSFALGGIERWDFRLLELNLYGPEQPLPFWLAFAIFFPAVTGFTQGVNMSGDLRDPGRAIPLGTFCAVGLSLVVYLLAPVLLAGSLSGPQLSGGDAMKSAAAFPLLVDMGAIAATLSSALASFLGAPRILQSLARDRIFPLLQPFARGVGSARNPRRAVLLAGLIALLTVFLGDLNLIAQVVTMFFLISYGLINYATYFEARSASPSFRPTFRFYDHRVSLAAAAACLAAMMVIDYAAGLLAVAVMAIVYQYLRFRGAPARWSDGRRSFHLQLVRDHLLEAGDEPEHPRDWRPMLLVVSDNSEEKRDRLLRLAGWLEGGAGLTTVVQVIEASEHSLSSERQRVLDDLEQAISAVGSDAFPLVVAAHNPEETLLTVIQAAGVGPLKTNTLLVAWERIAQLQGGRFARSRYASMLRMVAHRGINLVVLDADDDEWQKLADTPDQQRVIDVWWDDEKSGELLLLFAYLMQRTPDWDQAEIRLLTLCDPGEVETREAQLISHLADARVDAQVVALATGSSAAETIVEQSAQSSLVFLPGLIRSGHLRHRYGGDIPDLLDKLPIVVIATAVQDVDLDADPDDAVSTDENSDGDQAPASGGKEQ